MATGRLREAADSIPSALEMPIGKFTILLCALSMPLDQGLLVSPSQAIMLHLLANFCDWKRRVGLTPQTG